MAFAMFGADTGASSSSNRGNVDWSIERLVVSHHQHIIIRQAIIKGESERACSLFHEHVSASEEYHSLFPGDHKISGL